MLSKLSSHIYKRRLCKKIIRGKISLLSNTVNGLDLSYMNLSKTDIRGAKLRCAILSGTNFTDAILQGSVMEGAMLQNAKFQDANLIYVNFTGANLRGANLRNANIYNTNFTGADLSYADLTGVKVDRTTNFTNANLTKTKLNIEKINLACTTGATITVSSMYERFCYRLGLVSQIKINPQKILPIVPQDHVSRSNTTIPFYQ